ncbi:MAG: helix-hairpin-helix domain-containing protein [Actinomycetota bacterium]
MGGGFREWLAGLGRRELAVLALVGVALAGLSGVWFVRSLPRPVAVERIGGPQAGPSVGPSPEGPGPPIYVHVAGWVRRAGVYRLHLGDRVIDAIDRAGGPRPGAALDALNLAALLFDGQQVYVPRKGEAAPGSGSTFGTAGTAGGKININLATAPELETLPGIGEVLAQRIIDYREEHGPFASVDDLVNVSGIGEATLEELRDLVTV